MQPAIPVTRPQALPVDWSQTLGEVSIPTEREFSRFGVLIGIDTRALAFSVMHAFGKSTPQPPQLSVYGVGTFNKIFRATFTEDGETFDVAIRVAREFGRYPGRVETTAALMTFARYHLRLPVPKVYAWCDGLAADGNPVNAPYIMMEFIDVPQLWYALWHHQTPRREYWYDMMDIITKAHTALARPIPWTQYGSIYFAKNAGGEAQGRESDDMLRQLDTYRMGPFMPGTMAMVTPRVDLQPGPQVEWRGKESLTEFWTALWHGEVDAITKLHQGDDPSTLLSLYDSDSESDAVDQVGSGAAAGCYVVHSDTYL
ncbi:hypothetical protein CC2G_012418 [Coprinopsis cinerea AmutBmut pab1-1]|nr:hypothetical protein CC2G_012418 [Coprinopsis cinerea AmutBmut pab1-1]